MKLGDIQFLKNNTAGGSLLFMIGETEFPASGKHFFSHFSETLASFFPSSRNIFHPSFSFKLVETDFLASGNRFCLIRVLLLSGNCH